MAAEHDFIRRVLRKEPVSAAGFHWFEILTAMVRITQQPSAESESLLRDVLALRGKIPILEESGLPHALTPTEALHSMAVQTLATWDLSKHRDAISALAASTRSDTLAYIARSHLQRSGAPDPGRDGT